MFLLKPTNMASFLNFFLLLSLEDIIVCHSGWNLQPEEDYFLPPEQWHSVFKVNCPPTKNYTIWLQLTLSLTRKAAGLNGVVHSTPKAPFLMPARAKSMGQEGCLFPIQLLGCCSSVAWVDSCHTSAGEDQDPANLVLVQLCSLLASLPCSILSVITKHQLFKIQAECISSHSP